MRKEIPECNRRGEMVKPGHWYCDSNRLRHPIPGVASCVTCKRCPFVDMPDAVLPEPPKRGLLDLGLQFLDERSKWVAAGKPMRAPERVAEIYDTHCQPCEHFDAKADGTGTCKKCSCDIRRESKLFRLNKLAWATTECPVAKWHADVGYDFKPEYISLNRLSQDVLDLIGSLPHDLNGIVGIPRSGMLPAAMIATMLHLPLYGLNVHSGELYQAGKGVRLDVAPAPAGKLLVIDDSVHSGAQMTKARKALLGRPGIEPVYAAMYVLPKAEELVDIYARAVVAPHLFQWNLTNCTFAAGFAYDLDGVLCRDLQAPDDDGLQYQDALANARPYMLPRKLGAPLIVTGRVERHRQATEAWLKKHGVHFHKLIMAPFASSPERNRHGDMAAFKAEHFGKSSCWLFIESDPRQAKRIYELTGKTVLCPASEALYGQAPGLH